MRKIEVIQWVDKYNHFARAGLYYFNRDQQRIKIKPCIESRRDREWWETRPRTARPVVPNLRTPWRERHSFEYTLADPMQIQEDIYILLVRSHYVVYFHKAYCRSYYWTSTQQTRLTKLSSIRQATVSEDVVVVISKYASKGPAMFI